jgi:pyruvate/2-oxoacid:ferredoxin oxidoreductase alpha subunit
MPQILDNRNNLDQTVKIFDSFYAFNAVVNAVEYDVVYSYFVSVCATANIAGNFTAVLFRIAQETQIPVLQLLDQIKGTNKMEMNQVLAYYLNSFKSKTSLYGIAIVPKSNQPVSRNIVQ